MRIINHPMLLALMLVATFLVSREASAAQPWDDSKAGNPLLPGYFADPCCRKFGDTYYLYVTPDGWDVGKGPFAIWASKDFVHWTAHKSPSVEPGKFWPMTDFKWAPSVVQYQGKYYMYTQTPCMIWGAVADTPLGPWKSLSSPDKPLIPDQTPKGSIVLDGECFLDSDGQIYLWYSTWWTPTMARLNTDLATIRGKPIQYFKHQANPEPPKGVLQGCMEAPYMYKHNNTYYLMYSDLFCQDSTYCVKYSTSPSPDGPFTYGKNNPILSTNDDDTVDGPGHHTILEDGGKIYIVYHRHDNPHSPGGACRQVAIDELHFNSDGSIEKVVPSHSGVGYLAPSTVRDTNLALAKPATASSFAGADYPPGYATDENNGTLWKAREYQYPQWLQVDLGREEPIQRCETEFQFAQVGYRYRIEVSRDGALWDIFADRSGNAEWGPMIDRGQAKARFVRVTLLGDDAPERPNPEIAIWNFKVYDGIEKPNRAPRVDAGKDVTGTMRFPTRVVEGIIDDDGLPNGPVRVEWSKVSGPGDVVFEHPDKACSKATFSREGEYVLKLTADDGQLTCSGTVKFKILPAGDELAWFKFDEKSGTIAEDSSVNGRYGVMKVGTGRCPGMHGGAVRMGGEDFVSLPAYGAMDQLTLTAWINPYTLNADRSILASDAGGDQVPRAYLGRTGELRFAVGNRPPVASDFKFTPETTGWWKHIAIVCDGPAKQVHFYVDGELDSSRTLTDAGSLDLSASAKIGGAAPGLAGFNGELDDFWLCARALSTAEIAAAAKPSKFASIADLKKMADGTAVMLMAKVVTYAPMNPISFERSTDFFYVSERDGPEGILVRDGNARQDKVKPDHCVSFHGIVKSCKSGEKYLELTTAPSIGSPYEAKASENLQPASLVKITGLVAASAQEGKSLTLTADGTNFEVTVNRSLMIKRISVGNTVEVTGVIDSENFNKDRKSLLAREILRTNPPPDPLNAWYKFDEAGGTVAKDSSGNGADATLVNDAAWIDGKTGNAISLDGKKSFVQLPDLGLHRALTITMWVNANSLGADAWSTALVHGDAWNLGDLHFQVPCKAGNFVAAVNGAAEVSSKSSLAENLKKWNHVAMTYEAKSRQMALYVNGKLENTATLAESRPIDLSHCKLGSWGGGSRFFDGRIDDLRVYDQPLSAADIEAIYQMKK